MFASRQSRQRLCFAMMDVRILGRAAGGVKLLQPPETLFRLTAGIFWSDRDRQKRM